MQKPSYNLAPKRNEQTDQVFVKQMVSSKMFICGAKQVHDHTHEL